MATSSIETLLQSVRPARGAEPASRGAEGSPFAPVLSHALRAEPAAPSAGDEQFATDDEPQSLARGEDEPASIEESAERPTAAEEQAAAGAAAEPADAAESDEQESADADSDAEEAAAGDHGENHHQAAAQAAQAAIGAAVPADEGDEGEAATTPIDAAAARTQAESSENDGAEPSPTGAEQAAAVDPKKNSLVEFGDVLAREPVVADDGAEGGKRRAAAAAEGPRAAARNRSEAPGKKPVPKTAPDEQPPENSAEADGVHGAAAAELEEAEAPETDESQTAAANSAENRRADPAPAQSSQPQRGEPAEAPLAALPAEAPAEASLARGADAPASAAAPATSSPANEQSSQARGAAALARLSAERSMHSQAGADEDAAAGVDRARFVGRVEGAIRAAQQRDGRVQVRLSPPELGALRIELTLQHGVLSARMEAETPAARNLILDNLPALRERLAQQDVRVEQFDVDVRRDGGGSSSGQQEAKDRAAAETPWQRSSTRTGRTGPSSEAATARPAARPTASDAALDVRV